MVNIKKCLIGVYQHSILNTTRKKVFIYSITLYFPIITVMFGSPFPDLLKDTISFPFSLIDFDEVMVQLIETISTVLSIVGTISVGVFWIHKNSNNRHNETNDTINKLKEDLCRELNERFINLERKIEEKDRHQTQIFDQKILGNAIEIGNLKESDQELKQDIKDIERTIFNIRGLGGQQE